jgi:hypothetical protein
VGELAYTFSDIPWRNLDLSSPESGCSALLDVFCIQETDTNAIVAGKVDLNTRQLPVMNAVLSGSYVDSYGNASFVSLSPSLATNLAALLLKRTMNNSMGPLQNLSELVGKQSSSSLATPIDGASTNNYAGYSSDLDSLYAAGISDIFFNNISRFRESPIRALASTGQTRVWNLMLDLIVQTGKFPQVASGLNGFLVEGEARYWVHLAVDRLTGQVIDRQIEVVKE